MVRTSSSKNTSWIKVDGEFHQNLVILTILTKCVSKYGQSAIELIWMGNSDAIIPREGIIEAEGPVS